MGLCLPRCARWLLLGTASLIAAAGCTASSDEVRPPPAQFFFPTGLALSPDPEQTRLFVANANSELRYDSGTINVVKLDEVDMALAAWKKNRASPPDRCKADPSQPETLVCDEGKFIDGQAGVRIGNFATSLSVQDTGNGTLRLIVPVRGDPSITWIDWNGDRLSCDDSGGGFSLCDDKHRLTSIHNDDKLPIPEEPFRAYVDSAQNFAVITHLNSGIVTLVDTYPGQAPIVADVVGDIFQPGNFSASAGGTSVAGRTPGSPDNLLYVASRSEDRVQMLTVDRSGDSLPYLVRSNFFFLDAAGANNGGSSDTRGLAFADGGKRMLVANRRPPTLQIYDSEDDAAGFPKNTAVAVYDICRETSGLAVGNVGDPEGELALVSCFGDGTVYVIDATGRRATDAIVTVGRGPFDVVISPVHKKAYVTNFLEDTVGVIDLAPGSPTRFHEILRIGEPRL
jgi:YVTN family beta-propeller protein